MKEKELKKKFGMLETAGEVLKKEFIGLDDIIDEIIESVTSWFLYPELQEKPLVINLWGMTGVGKSSLVRRFAELIDFRRRFYNIDLGTPERQSTVIDTMEDIYENENGKAVILGLDEFQYARTINEEMHEEENHYSRGIWQLLDSGRFYFNREQRMVDRESLHAFFEVLIRLQKNNVVIREGKIIRNRKFFVKYFQWLDKINQIMTPVVAEEAEFSDMLDHWLDEIARIWKLMGCETLEKEEACRHYSIADWVAEMRNVIEFAYSEWEIDATKSLIFVMGNLDEAYQMSGNFSRDISADEFHRNSLEITLPDIKNALRTRLRNEQISRLGNKHIIYPAFSSESFRQIIRMELENSAAVYGTKLNVSMTFDGSVHEMIYQEAVVPTQGVRPVQSSVSTLVNSYMGKIQIEVLRRKIRADLWEFNWIEGRMEVGLYRNDVLQGQVNYHPVLKHSTLKERVSEDMQAMASVHEAGHSLCFSLLLGRIPEEVLSVTENEGNPGMTILGNETMILHKQQVIPQIACGLAGWTAEKMIFGENFISAGSTDDINKVTELASDAVRTNGLHTLPFSWHIPSAETVSFLHERDDRINREIEKLLRAGLELAEFTLQQNQDLFRALVNVLTEEGSIRKFRIRSLIDRYAASKFPKKAVPDYRLMLEDFLQRADKEVI